MDNTNTPTEDLNSNTSKSNNDVPQQLKNDNTRLTPSPEFLKEIENQKVEESKTVPIPSTPASIYPSPVQSPNQTSPSPVQQAALNTVEKMTLKTNKPVSLRVISLLVFAILSILFTLFIIVITVLGNLNTMTLFILALYALQLLMSIYLLIGKDHNTVALVLKVFLVFTGINTVLSMSRPLSLFINIGVFVYLFFVYLRVKNLTYS